MALGKCLIALGMLFVVSVPVTILRLTGAEGSWPLFRLMQVLDKGVVALHKMIAPPGLYVLEAVSDAYFAKALALASDLSIPDHLNLLKSASCGVLSERLKIDPDKLSRLMRFLSSKGVFTELSEDIYANNEYSELIMSGGSLKMVMTLLAGDAYPGLNYLNLDMEASGKVMYEKDFLGLVKRPGHQDMKTTYKRVVGVISEMCANSTVTNYPWWRHSRQRTISIGASGRIIFTALRYQPLLTGTIFDVAEAINQAQRLINYTDIFQLNRRLVYEPVLDLDPVWPGYDLYILDHMLMRHTDEAALRILQLVSAAMRRTKEIDPESDPILLIADLLGNSGVAERILYAVDMHLIALVHGKVRSERGLRNLLHKSGLQVRERFPMQSLSSVLTASLLVP